jgi:hypothetical protein
MNIKQIALTVVSIFYIVIFFKIPTNNEWVHDRVLNFLESIHDDLDKMGIEERRIARWGATYTDARTIRDFLDSIHIKKPLLLIPPKDYVDVYFKGSIIPEPLVFYYFSGLKTAFPTSKNVYSANCAIVVDNGAFGLRELTSKASIDSVLFMYKHPNHKK